jgi:hypothetical protein
VFGVIAGSAQTPAESAAPQSRITDTYGRLPLTFEVNRGQTDKRVRFLARGSGYAVFLTGQEAVLALHASPSGNPAAHRNGDVLQMQLLGANPSAEPQGADPLSGTVSYFRGNDPFRWQSGVPTFARVKFTGVYPGIDLVYYGNQSQLEYDFVVAPKADPKAVRLHFAGAAKLQLATTGDLTVRVKNGRVIFHKPYVYQEEAGRRRVVAGRFTLRADNSVGFALGAYDHEKPLVIDPVLVYATYLGGSTTDEAFGIAVDASGNTYITGTTSSADFPVTQGSYQTTQKSAAHTQIFITKLNPTGTALIYSTYLGGSGDDDHASAIAVSAAGNAYVTGYAQTLDFPTTPGAFQETRPSNGGTGFVTELNPTGTKLVYSTYLGGSGGEAGNAIALDSSGDAFVTGSTQSPDFPVTPGAFSTTIPGFRSAFVTKLNAAGTALVYSTFLGGSGYDQALAIAVDTAGSAYVGGGAASQDFPVTAGAFQQTKLAGANATGFIAKLNPAGSDLSYATYLGGSTGEQVRTIAVDAAGTAYAGGHTNSSDFPVTPGAFQGASHSGAGFVTHLNATGSALSYSTFLGPVSSVYDDGPHSIRVDSAGEAYVTGQSLPGFPVTPGAFQSTCSTLTSAYITRLNSTGTALVYSTCLGGTRGTFGNAIAINAAGQAFVAGGTIASDFPVSSGAFQTVNKTNNNFVPTGFVASFDTNPAAAVTDTALTSSANPQTFGQSVTFTAKVSESGGTTPTGNVEFLVDGADKATTALSSGAATYTTSTLTVGTHTIKTNYAGNAQFSASSDSLTETIQAAQATPPIFSPAVGTYSSPQNVTLSDATSGAVIYYTINGSTPTTNSTLYSGPILVSTTETIKAIATATGFTQSAVASGEYVIQQPVVTVSPGSLSFGNQTMGTSSAAQSVTVKNTGTGALTLTGFPITGSTYFAQTNNCGESLAAGASCTLSVVFTPQAQGAVTATLTVNSNASGSAPTVTLTGTGTAPPAPVVSLTPTSLAFGNQMQGTSSAAQTITVKNTGNAALTGITITLTEGSSGSSIRSVPVEAVSIASTHNYSATTTCGSSLDAGTSCAVSVTFSPTTTGSLPGTVSVGDNAAGSPQTAGLSGTGTAVAQGEFTVIADPSSATAMPGAAAQFHITVGTTGGPFDNAVRLTATGLPEGASATFAPASLTPGSATATSVLTIQTAASAAANRNPKPLWPMASPVLALFLFAIPGRLRRQWSRRMRLALLALASLGAATAVTACGGGFALPRTSVTSTITITATSGSDVHTTTVQLTVN